MKPNILRRITASVLSLAVVVLSASTTVFATGDTYLLGGETQTVQEGDLFGTAFKGLMPGDDKSWRSRSPTAADLRRTSF
jgi:hypothetical protein